MRRGCSGESTGVSCELSGVNEGEPTHCESGQGRRSWECGVHGHGMPVAEQMVAVPCTS